MADAGEETAAQRQARIRREKREAKIKAGGTERLEKITKLSGRTPDTMRDDYPSASPSPAPQASPPSQAPPPSMPPMSNPDDPAQLQAQQEYIWSLLRAQEPQPGQDKQAEDPMMKVLNSLLGGADGSDPAEPGGLPFSPDDISKATGLPPFLTNMFLGQAKVPPTAAEEQTARICALVRVVLSLVIGIYVVYILSSSSKMYGSSPPAPPTLKNPFLVFITGEIFLHTTQMLLLDGAVPKGMWAWWQILKDTARDGSIVVFMMGAASWLSTYR